jgi:hypothetical protein
MSRVDPQDSGPLTPRTSLQLKAYGIIALDDGLGRPVGEHQAQARDSNDGEDDGLSPLCRTTKPSAVLISFYPQASHTAIMARGIPGGHLTHLGLELSMAFPGPPQAACP